MELIISFTTRKDILTVKILLEYDLYKVYYNFLTINLVAVKSVTFFKLLQLLYYGNQFSHFSVMFLPHITFLPYTSWEIRNIP